MKKKTVLKEADSSSKTNTLIAKDTIFKGTIISEGIVRVDGEMEGEIVAKGSVIIGQSGRAKLNIKAANVVISGHLEGAVDAEGKLQIKETGVLKGDVKAFELSILDGAVFSGISEMKSREPQVKEAASPPLNNVTGENVIPDVPDGHDDAENREHGDPTVS